MRPLFVTGIAIAMALRLGLEQTFQGLRERRSGLRPGEFACVDLHGIATPANGRAA